jgi:hypothetical protein
MSILFLGGVGKKQRVWLKDGGSVDNAEIRKVRSFLKE